VLDAGAEWVQIGLGGDVRVAGTGQAAGTWRVAIGERVHGGTNPVGLDITDSGVSTNATALRRARGDGYDVQHPIDPETGLPASTDLDAVTVVAPTLWWAQVMSNVALRSGAANARAILGEYDLTAVLVGPERSRGYELISPPKVVA
jgi:thiamine biosynthesis lipoprotein